MTNYIIVLPPSEGKRAGGDENKPYRMVKNLGTHNSFISLESDRDFVHKKLLEAFGKLSERELEKLFGVKDKNLISAIETVSDMQNSPSLAAISRYDGVTFRSIDHENMDEVSRNNFNDSTVFVSGMFGLLRPMDLIPDYKLKIDSKFLDLDLTSFWKNRLKGDFDIITKDKTVIDILPQAHRKVTDYSRARESYEIIFMISKEGKLKQAGHDSKILKGEIVRYISSFDEISRDDLEKFEHSEGYKYDEELSDENRLVYLKN